MEPDLDAGESSINSYSLAAITDGTLLHSRLGHPGSHPFSKAFPGITPPMNCGPCIMAEHHQLAYQGRFEVATEKLEMLHSELSGIITPPSLGGNHYYFKISDSCTSSKFVFMLQSTSQKFNTFVQFKKMIENQTSKRIKTMVNDNGGEYTSALFSEFVKEHGIRMHLTAPYTPQQTPVANIGNKTTTKKARALLKQARLPTVFWAEAVTTSVYLKNITPIASRGFLTPHKLWYGHPPSYKHLRVFGCLSYVHVGRDWR